MYKVTRRSFVSTLSAVACVPVAPALAKSLPVTRGHAPTRATPSRAIYGFFDAREASFIEPACECLIPSRNADPGADGSTVAHYLDRQLSSAWGAGERLFRDGGWQPGSTPRVPLPFTPATLFRTALGAINRGFERRATAFAALSSDARESFLARLQSGGVALDGAPPGVFFDLLLRMTIEGFFSNPSHGPTRDRVAWRVVGFPGAHAASLTALHWRSRA
jgi:gluconate 2-dehydrogenase gamma chain